ncbi:hypothetical protein G6F56_008001 [Rhizopus delemar]|nr:hypothetical protein G6F56_008001 [Rhizopus delemar]
MSEGTIKPAVTFDDNPVIKETVLPDFKARTSQLSIGFPPPSLEPNVPEGELTEEVVEEAVSRTMDESIDEIVNKTVDETVNDKVNNTVDELVNESTEDSLDDSTEEEKEDDDEEDLYEVDRELERITELNRFVSYEEPTPDLNRPKSLRSLPFDTRADLLVFADEPNTSQSSDRIIVKSHYGAGLSGQLDEELRPTRSSRAYLIACDFSEESIYAVDWAMGSMLRDGDTLHVVTVVKKKEKAKKRIKLLSEIEELSLSMIICGCKKQSRLKWFFMDSVSSYLIETSSIPVTVIKQQKNKKKKREKRTRAPRLSETVQSGLLAVDELSRSN